MAPGWPPYMPRHPALSTGFIIRGKVVLLSLSGLLLAPIAEVVSVV